MAQIPYNPVPQVGPSGQGIQGFSVRANEDAFGGGIAAEGKKLGAAFEKAGDEIFSVAMKLQNQHNDAIAKDADAKYIIESSNLHADYNSLQGQDAIKARPKYLEDLTAVRERIRESLPNPAAQKLYDSSTRQNFARTVFASASHAAQQGKKYIKNSNEAVYTASREQTLAFPDDPVLFQDNERKAVNAARDVARDAGLPPEAVNNAAKDARSGITADRLIGLARKDPIRAGEMLADLPADVLRQKDRERAEKIIIDGKRTTYSKLYADEVTFGLDPEDPKKTTEELIGEATQKAEKLIAQDPLLEVAIRDRVITDVNRARGLRKEKDWQTQNVIEGLVGGITTPEGVKPTTVEQLTATPEGRAAWEALDNKKQNMYRKQLALNSGSKLRETTQAEYFRLQGMAEEDPSEFLNQSVATNDKLSNADQRKLYDLQQKKRKEPDKDPQVQAAMRSIRPLLQSSGITPDRKDDYYQFQGAMQDAMADYRQQNKKPMPYDEVQLTAARLIQNQSFGTGDRWLGVGNQPFFPGKQPIYRTSVPEKERALIIDAYQRKNGIVPEESIIQRDYVRQQYNALYGKKASAPKDGSKPATNTLGPQVPQ